MGFGSSISYSTSDLKREPNFIRDNDVIYHFSQKIARCRLIQIDHTVDGVLVWYSYKMQVGTMLQTTNEKLILRRIAIISSLFLYQSSCTLHLLYLHFTGTKYLYIDCL